MFGDEFNPWGMESFYQPTYQPTYGATGLPSFGYNTPSGFTGIEGAYAAPPPQAPPPQPKGPAGGSATLGGTYGTGYGGNSNSGVYGTGASTPPAAPRQDKLPTGGGDVSLGGSLPSRQTAGGGSNLYDLGGQYGQGPTVQGGGAPRTDPLPAGRKEQVPGGGGGDGGGGLLTSPGAGEQAWGEHGQDYFKPTDSSQYYNSVKGDIGGHVPRNESAAMRQAFGDWYRGPGQTYSEQLFGEGGGPGGLDAYYKHAGSRAQERLDQAMAARGLFNSGVAADETVRLQGDLAAEQANREAAYRADLARQADASRLGEMGGMTGLAGGLDSGDIARGRLGLDSIALGGQLAGQSDSSWLARTNSGMSNAFRAQDAFEGRERGNLHDMLGMGGMLSGVYGDYMKQALGDYWNAELGKVQGGLNLGAFGYDQANADRNASQAGIANTLRVLAAAGII